ncbi:MAG: thioesterase family protein [Clostridia bacterium]|nr:thioesterase family protein [Clostridia bacterium]
MLAIGIKGKMERMVTNALSAKAMGSGELDVFATPAMVALIEETAWRSVAGELDEGCGTVGTKLDIAHTAATPLGMKVTCETELTAIDRRKLVFSVRVYDEAGEVGSGTHERFIVDNAKFQAKADAKAVQNG